MTSQQLPIPNDPALLLTIKQTAARLQVSRWSVYQLINQNKLATIKLGSARRVPVAALAECVGRLRETGGTDL